MKKETLEKANDLLESRADLESLIYTLTIAEQKAGDRTLTLSIGGFNNFKNGWENGSAITGRENFLKDIGLDESIQEIIADCADSIVRKIQKKIASLEKEFDALSDK